MGSKTSKTKTAKDLESDTELELINSIVGARDYSQDFPNKHSTIILHEGHLEADIVTVMKISHGHSSRPGNRYVQINTDSTHTFVPHIKGNEYALKQLKIGSRVIGIDLGSRGYGPIDEDKIFQLHVLDIEAPENSKTIMLAHTNKAEIFLTEIVSQALRPEEGLAYCNSDYGQLVVPLAKNKARLEDIGPGSKVIAAYKNDQLVFLYGPIDQRLLFK